MKQAGDRHRHATTAAMDQDIAVVGIGCWYPGARNALQLWENVVARRRQFRRFPDSRLPVAEYYDADPNAPDKLYIPRAAFIDGFEFDWAGRRIPKGAFESTDIVQWLALEVAGQAIEDAGYSRDSIPKDRTGVIVGNSLTGEQSRASTMRLRWPYVRKVFEKTARAMHLPAAQIERLAGTMECVYKSAFAEVTEDTLQGGLSNTIAGRVCNYFDLHGGGYVVDGACSSSLLAVCTAASYLAAGDLDVVLAGGVDVSLDPFELVGFAKTGALAANREGDINVYDLRGAGFLPGEGCGFVVLKRLSDARKAGDTVYAVVKGWGISSDGKGGITAPSRDGQALALVRAYERAAYSPHGLDFVEGHGTGTAVGDRTELAGIARAFGEYGDARPRSCGVTSFKSIVGHTKAAAGVGAFIKAAIAVNRRVVPPTAGYREPNPILEEQARALFPVRYGTCYESDRTLRAGVSAMGFGGINSHVTLESADPPCKRLTPALDERALLVSGQDSELFVIGADSLQALCRQLVTLEQEARDLSVAELTDLAAYLASECPRGAHARAAVVASTPSELMARLGSLSGCIAAASTDSPPPGDQEGGWWSIGKSSPRIGFLFPGQGSQQLAMGRLLVERYPWAQRMVDMADRAASELLGKPLSPVLYQGLDQVVTQSERKVREQALVNTSIAQPAIVLASCLYARYLRELGIEPHLVAGHSLGELTAFQVAGAFNEETLIRLALVRGSAMAEDTGTGGGMASLACGQQQAEELLAEVSAGYIVVANINAPDQTVVSGEVAAVDQVERICAAAGIACTRLRVSGAFHSRLVEAAAERLRRDAPLTGNLESLDCLLLSGIGGDPVHPGLDLRAHFSRQVVSRVDFRTLVANAARDCDLLLEVGPGRVLSGLVARTSDRDRPVCLPVASDADSTLALNEALARTYVTGAELRWETLYDRRLVRPYITPSQRVFIDNPCERPTLDVEPEAATTPMPGSQVLGETEGWLADAFGVDPATLRNYVRTRGAFLGRIIRADVETATERETAAPATSSAALSPDTVAVPATAATAPDTEPAGADRLNEGAALLPEQIGRMLVSLVAVRTGFPAESIPMDARLLDDLNLDSIKAGELIAEAARQVGRAGELDPAGLANATLKEVVGALSGTAPDVAGVGTVASPPLSGSGIGEDAGTTSAADSSFITSGPADDNGQIIELLMEMVADKTGFPADSLSPDYRLLDDLNLDSIKAGELVSALVTRLGVAGTVDPAALANARLSEIAKAVAAANTQSVAGEDQTGDESPTVEPVELSPGASQGHPPGVAEAADPDAAPASASGVATVIESWVREYAITPVPAPLVPAPGHGLWHEARILVVTPGSQEDLASETLAHFQRLGATVDTVGYAELVANGPPVSAGMTHVLALLPGHAEAVDTELEQIARSADRLAGLVAVMSATGADTLLVAQFAGGRFGQLPGETPDIESSGVVSFVSTLWLERPQMKTRVVDLSPALPVAEVPRLFQQELETEPSFAVAGYDGRKQRHVLRADVLQPAHFQSRDLNWTERDVFLITGGGKGITAECALALARQTGARFALVGSTKLPGQSAPPGELGENLKRFEQLGVRYRYYSCDITDPESVAALIRQVKGELGPISAVIHGAGINRPRPTAQVDAQEGMKEIAPKLLGAINLCRALKYDPPRLVLALSSIIGITGMRGNAWYAYSNEALDLALRRFAVRCPGTAVVSLAYSVWGEVGMGHRLGVVQNLEQSGVGAISTREGVERFLRHISRDAGHQQVVIAGKLSGLPTWACFGRPPGVFDDMRFVEQLLETEPGVELTAACVLSLDRDLYLRDHDFHGSCLFPTVFGLEAMAQVATALTGRDPSDITGFEHVVLERPVVVSEGRGTEIRIHALAQEENVQGLCRVQVGIFAEQTGFAQPHFSATVVFGTRADGPVEGGVSPGIALPLSPGRDLYGRILFQGPLFQRLENIYRLNTDRVVFSGETRESLFDGDNGFAPGEGGSLIVGDPFFRDTLLQSVQLPLAPEVVLPIGIGAIELYMDEEYENGNRIVSAELKSGAGGEYSWDIVVTNDLGRVVEVLRDYRVRVLKGYRVETDKIAKVKEISTDVALIEAGVQATLAALIPDPPVVRLAHAPQLHGLGKPERHEVEQPLVESVVALWNRKRGGVPTGSDLRWTASGQPRFSDDSTSGAGLSLSHDDELCLCVVGPLPQGCDIEPVSKRAELEWCALLGEARFSLLGELEKLGDTRDVAGTRIWCAVEAARKAFGGSDVEICIDRSDDSAIVFEAVASGGVIAVITGLYEGQVIGTRVIAVAADNGALVPAESASIDGADTCTLGDVFYRQTHASRMVRDPVLNQEVYEYVFQPTFKESANLSRTVFYTSYLAWIGKVRELFMAEIGHKLVSQIASGQWGLVTNWADVQIFAEASAYDRVVARFRLGRLSGSVIPLYCEFYRLDGDDHQVLLARVEQETTWVEVIGHGVVRPVEFPAYFSEFLRRTQQPDDSPGMARLDQSDFVSEGEVLELYGKQGPAAGLPILDSMTHRCTLEDANLVGNVYYANYFIWQGRVRDQFLFDRVPEYFRGTGRRGELICTHSHLDYLRDAMPFDDVIVCMRLRTLSNVGAELVFEYYRTTADGGKEKLAIGTQQVFWVIRDRSSGKVAVAPLPDDVKAAFLGCVEADADELTA